MMNKIDGLSETAIIVASLRALSNYESDINFNCNDQYAELFLPGEKRNPLKDHQSREMIKSAIPKGMYEYVISRTKYFDYIFNQSIKKDFKQIVFLGAGFDSRPYRFNDLIKNIKIFEVDTFITQEYKKSLLVNKCDSSENIVYVSTDFEEIDLFGKLEENGYDRTLKTLFLWEGVTFYLTKESVLRILKDIKENSASYSRICFDFQTMRSMDELIKTGLKEESIKFGIEEGYVIEFVKRIDYDIIEHLSAEMIEQKFMIKSNGEHFGRIAPMMNFILIEHK